MCGGLIYLRSNQILTPKEQNPKRPKNAETSKQSKLASGSGSHHCLAGLFPPELLRAAESVGECRLVVARVVVQQPPHDRVAVLSKPTGRLREDSTLLVQERSGHIDEMKERCQMPDKDN